ncbi:Hypothetical_protein [Hexamita inflata]|uniref:Hypothetical_protein n=1 Tax=Hexamita inflata TaxID=28002 RepID=A0AA86UEW6_9EUKA|nr:Hypothetical protein HINF_LOCUS40694 [Hexamita inflata]
MKYMLLLSYTSLYSIVWDNEKPLLCNRKQCKFQQKRTVIEKLYSSFTGVLQYSLQPKMVILQSAGCKNNSLSFSSHSLQIIAAQGLDWMDLSSVSINEEYLHAQPDEVKARWASLV